MIPFTRARAPFSIFGLILSITLLEIRRPLERVAFVWLVMIAPPSARCRALVADTAQAATWMQMQAPAPAIRASCDGRHAERGGRGGGEKDCRRRAAPIRGRPRRRPEAPRTGAGRR